MFDFYRLYENYSSPTILQLDNIKTKHTREYLLYTMYIRDKQCTQDVIIQSVVQAYSIIRTSPWVILTIKNLTIFLHTILYIY